jgi:hypothetical protein
MQLSNSRILIEILHPRNVWKFRGFWKNKLHRILVKSWGLTSGTSSRKTALNEPSCMKLSRMMLPVNVSKKGKKVDKSFHGTDIIHLCTEQPLADGFRCNTPIQRTIIKHPDCKLFKKLGQGSCSCGSPKNTVFLTKVNSSSTLWVIVSDALPAVMLGLTDFVVVIGSEMGIAECNRCSFTLTETSSVVLVLFSRLVNHCFMCLLRNTDLFFARFCRVLQLISVNSMFFRLDLQK